MGYLTLLWHGYFWMYFLFFLFWKGRLSCFIWFSKTGNQLTTLALGGGEVLVSGKCASCISSGVGSFVSPSIGVPGISC